MGGTPKVCCTTQEILLCETGGEERANARPIQPIKIKEQWAQEMTYGAKTVLGACKPQELYQNPRYDDAGHFKRVWVSCSVKRPRPTPSRQVGAELRSVRESRGQTTLSPTHTQALATKAAGCRGSRGAWHAADLLASGRRTDSDKSDTFGWE